jgi:hypothetical protein
MDLTTELRTWISCQDRDGYTFTQSVCGGVMDIADIVMVSSPCACLTACTLILNFANYMATPLTHRLDMSVRHAHTPTT